MSSSFCETCKIVFEDGKRFCRVCGSALSRHSALRPGSAVSACPVCALQYVDGRHDCAFCGQALAPARARVPSGGGEAAATDGPPAGRKPVSGPGPRISLQPLSVRTQHPLSVSKVAALFRPAGQQAPREPPAREEPRRRGWRLRATAIAAFLLATGLVVAGGLWGVPLAERLWGQQTRPSAPASDQPTPQPPAAVEAQPRPVAPPSVRPPTAEAHNARGIELAQAGDVEGAIAAFRRAASVDPKNFKARNNLGVLYKQKGLTAQAIVEYRAASKAEPANPVPYKNMAILYEEQGRLREALPNYVRYLELAPNAWDADVIRSKVRDLRTKTENAPAR